MKALVTGGTGFIGTRLIERLREAGTEVVCVAKDRLNAATLESLGVSVVLGDLNNGIPWEELLNNVDYIYHLAGVTRASLPREYYEGNHEATKRFLGICTRHSVSVKRFVYLSSLAAVGPAPLGFALDESAPFHPVSDYGRSKMLGEMEVRRAMDRLPVTIIRPSAVYGPRERDMFEYIRLIKRGIHPLIGFRTKLLSLLHVEDLVTGILLAAERTYAEGRTYFLGSETFYSNEQIGEAIAEAVDVRPRPFRIPHTLMYTLGALSSVIARITGKQVFLNFQKVRECVQSAWICSVDKAKNELGFRQSIPLREGMKKTYEWYREHGWI
jgi:nucleoside-diphosphate-sugar epimerase